MSCYGATVDEDAFWDTIDQARADRGNCNGFSEAITRQLRALPAGDLRDFNDRWVHYWRSAFAWPVWDGARLLLGALGDDGFMDFRHWLISRGRDVFESVMLNPDNLASLAGDLSDFLDCDEVETLGSEAGTLYHEMTGEWPDGPGRDPDEPAGTPTDLRNARVVAARFPRLQALTPPIQV